MVTIVRQKKRQFETMLYSFAKDTMSGTRWPLEDVMTMKGYRHYYQMIEGDSINRIVEHIGKKVGADIVKMIKEQIKA